MTIIGVTLRRADSLTMSRSRCQLQQYQHFPNRHNNVAIFGHEIISAVGVSMARMPCMNLEDIRPLEPVIARKTRKR